MVVCCVGVVCYELWSRNVETEANSEDGENTWKVFTMEEGGRVTC